MTIHSTIFKLRVQTIEQVCLFELAWGKGQSLTKQVGYPADVIQLYQEWQRAYLGFYQSGQLRGRAGNITASVVDWRTRLGEAETKLTNAFDYWLRSAELYDLRSQIASSAQQSDSPSAPKTEPIQVFLTCGSIELERLPWETWKISEALNANLSIQILRAPLNIRDSANQQVSQPQGKRARILAVLGDDTGLNFEADRQAVESLQAIADIQFVGWQPEQTATQVIQQIADAIADQRGWDVLFFAGHSDETDLTGGELSIAPGVTISLRDITPQLVKAKQNGLQVAIFNSCSGLSLANALIDLGLSQVAVMREPIHNAVAQKFLWEFLQGLGQHLDVYDAIQLAQNFLATHRGAYPSAALVPSLFCHPGAERFRIPPPTRRRFRVLRPTWVEAIALCASIALSVLPPVQDGLLAARLLTQAYYRSLTGQVPAQTAAPIALIQIDTESIYRQGLSQLHPINRSYLARLVDRLQQLNAPVVGIDVLLDTPQMNPRSGDNELAVAVRRAVDQQTWLVFSAILDADAELGVSQATGIASQNWTMQGYTDAYPDVVELSAQETCDQSCPFSYLLALVQTARQELPQLPQPNRGRSRDLRTELLAAIAARAPKDSRLADLWRVQFPLGLQPLVDFSLPPDRIYQRIPAWKLLANAQSLDALSNQVVLIAGGCDERLGFTMHQSDCLPTPPATAFWSRQSGLTGGESLAYMTHHFLTQRFVVPIPDLWMIGLAALLGKGVVMVCDRRRLNRKPIQRHQILVGTVATTAGYGLIGLQLYISGAVLLPWLLPSVVLWSYVLSDLRKKDYD